MNSDRKARIANGALVLGSAVLACAVDWRFAWVTLFMGISLIFSGITGFCGWKVIFDKISQR